MAYGWRAAAAAPADWAFTWLSSASSCSMRFCMASRRSMRSLHSLKRALGLRRPGSAAGTEQAGGAAVPTIALAERASATWRFSCAFNWTAADEVRNPSLLAINV
jgi:hypothetical protein